MNPVQKALKPEEIGDLIGLVGKPEELDIKLGLLDSNGLKYIASSIARMRNPGKKTQDSGEIRELYLLV